MFDNTGGSGGTGQGQGGSGGGSTSTTTGGGGGQGGAPPVVCEPGLPPYAGPLCGPASAPCALLADETLASPPSFRNDAPAIAVDGSCVAHIAYSVAEGGFHGFYARRDAAMSWSEAETPFPIALGSVVATPEGVPFVLASDGSSSVSLWNLVGGQWIGPAQIPGQATVWAGGMGRDGAGVLHAAVMGPNSQLLLAQYEGGWTTTPISGAQISARVPLALSPEGTPQMAYWFAPAGGGGWQLYWVAPPGAPEVAAPLGSNGLDLAHQRQSIVVTPADGQNPEGRPHLFFARPLSGGQRQEVVYATRQGAGAWNVLPVDAESAQATYCTGEPMDGDTCDFDYEQISPIGIVASQGGDVRFVYAKVHRLGTMVAVCDQGLPFCYWGPMTDNSDGQIFVAWMEGNQQAGRAPLGSGILGTNGTLVLDALGRIHVALYDMPLGASGSTVRYLQIGE